MSNNTRSIDDKTKAALKGYVIASVNALTRQIDEATPKIRAAVENDEIRVACDLLDELRLHTRNIDFAIGHSVSVQNLKLFPEEEMLKEDCEPRADRKLRKREY